MAAKRRVMDQLSVLDSSMPCGQAIKEGQSETEPFLNVIVNFGQEGDTSKTRHNQHERPLCGHTKANLTLGSRGNDLYALYGEFPYHATIYQGNETTCSAAIINEFWVITAADCIHPSALRYYSVTVGEQRLQYQDTHEQNFKLSKIIHPELWPEKGLAYDIALIKITPTRDGHGIQFNDYVQPICLADSEERLPAGTNLTTTGWGPASETGRVSDQLKKAVRPLITDASCGRYFEIVAQNSFCLEDKKADSQMCPADTGAPVTYQSRGIYILYGIHTSGPFCDPTVIFPQSFATSVSAFRNWIDMNIINNSNAFEADMPVRQL